MTTLIRITALVLVVILGRMLYLAEQDAAYWHEKSKSVPQLEEDVRILQVALQNFCKPIEAKKMKLASPLGDAKLRRKK